MREPERGFVLLKPERANNFGKMKAGDKEKGLRAR